MTIQKKIPCVIMRGGTSRGTYFLANDLPREWEKRKEILTAAMGSGDPLQVNGVGGGNSLTSKAAIISRSTDPDADIDYLFAQVSIEQNEVDITPSCGNILSGAAPLAIEYGLVTANDGETRVRVKNVNTNTLIEVVVQTPNGFVEYEGDATIDGVPGSGAPILLKFFDVCGTKTGELLPTGSARDTFDGVEVSCVDAAMPMVLIPAQSLGVKGSESKQELDANSELLQKIESIRLQASLKMGLGDATGKVIPKVGLLSVPQFGGTITSRYFVPQNCHTSHSVTGAICVSVSCMLPGSVAYDLITPQTSNQQSIVVEHPSGKIDLLLEGSFENNTLDIKSAGLMRTARMLFKGEVHIPAKVWDESKIA
ncbi:hypothetical protein PESP_a1519 [Pseudoalteromonas espejiana DSM 9414]|nr:4-oxalomesaconate tautomerase [Pseudoalteromonas espejiana]ASM49625.1 hypothetical protein PESP_a1519 [Pseudoalteromonas espejiana DSM 9414]